MPDAFSELLEANYLLSDSRGGAPEQPSADPFAMQGFGGPLPAKPRGKRQGETDQRQIADQYLLFHIEVGLWGAYASIMSRGCLGTRPSACMATDNAVPG